MSLEQPATLVAPSILNSLNSILRINSSTLIPQGFHA